jgi:hypothetical protein
VNVQRKLVAPKSIAVSPIVKNTEDFHAKQNGMTTAYTFIRRAEAAPQSLEDATMTTTKKTKEETEKPELKLDVKKVRTGVKAGGWCGFSIRL